MSRKVGEVFEDYEKIDYVYDFGSSTELSISYIDDICCDNTGGSIKLLLRNEMPDFKCSKCNKNAGFMCPYCMNEYCEKCGGKHECIENDESDIMMPIVNSQRSGVCGYEGTDDKYLKKYLPK